MYSRRISLRFFGRLEAPSPAPAEPLVVALARRRRRGRLRRVGKETRDQRRCSGGAERSNLEEEAEAEEEEESRRDGDMATGGEIGRAHV